MEQKKKIKIAIIILAVLLGCSLLALGGTLVHNKLAGTVPAAVTVPDNLITPDGEAKASDSSDEAEEKTTSDSKASATGKTQSTKQKSASTTADNTSATTVSATAGTKRAANIELYDKQPEENTPFQVGNMFPGDSETKYFRVQVSYKNKVTVHYKATVREGYEKLAEVMMIRIKMLGTGETLYNGLMRDMPESITYELTSAESTTDELYYEITAYLDTSVGNEYQNKDLIADFSWWAEETVNLEPTPRTGSGLDITLWACLAVASGGVMFFLLLARKRREEEEANV